MTSSLISELALLREAARRGTDNRSEQETVIAAIARETRIATLSASQNKEASNAGR